MAKTQDKYEYHWSTCRYKKALFFQKEPDPDHIWLCTPLKAILFRKKMAAEQVSAIYLLNLTQPIRLKARHSLTTFEPCLKTLCTLV